MKFKSDIEVQAGLKDSSGAAGTSGQVLSSNGATVSWINSDGGFANDVQNTVKAGVAINKGQAVYVTSANGTNIIVGLASNTSEATSSKTLGLLNATVAINGFADVIQIGKLAGLDTSTAVIGDPVWLGTNGNLIYGLANKPYAPAHLVYIGVVTRVNASNGEIFVTVQNGFELKEIHDVDIVSTPPSNNDILTFEGGTVNLWKNKSISSIGGIEGSGTQNTLPKFTGTSTIGNSTITDNTTFVGMLNGRQGLTLGADVNGIVVTSNTNKRGAINVPQYGNPSGLPIGIISAGTNSTNNTIAIGGTQGGYSLAADVIQFALGSGYNSTTQFEAARFTNAGNLLLNTTTDSGFRLDVNGTARVQGALTATADSSINGVNIGLGGGAIVSNTRVGVSALNANTTGSNNTSIGVTSLRDNTIGSLNSSLGVSSQQNNVSGNSNSSLGAQSLLSNLSGSLNVALGRESGRFIANGTTANTITNNSVYIGASTKALADNQTNQIVIGYDSTGLGSNTTVLGNASTTATAIYGNLLLGTTTNSTFKLDVTGTTRLNGLQTIQGTTASDTAPLGSELATVTGTGANWTLAGTNLNVGGYTHTTGDVTPLTTTLAAVSGTYYQIAYTITGRTTGSITINYGGTVTSGITATGATGPLSSSTAALTITPTTDFNGTVVLSIKSIGTSSATTTFLSSAGTATNAVRVSDTISNTLIGINAGRRNTTATSSTFIGNNAGQNNTTGGGNTFIGQAAGGSNNIGGANTFVGNASGVLNTAGVQNTFLGASSGSSNTTGNNNTFLGQASGLNNSTGGTNTFIGVVAGNANTTGSGNTAIGQQTFASSTNGTNNVAIGNTALFGLTGTNANNVALGTNAGRYAGAGTTAMTSVNNSIYLGYQSRGLNATGSTNEIVIGYDVVGLGSNSTVLGNNSTTTTAIYGDLGIGTTAPNYVSSGRRVIDINGASQSMLSLSVGGVGKGFLFHTGTDLLVSNEGNGAIKLNTNGSQKVVIEAGGNVGIGTTSPVYKFHVNDTSDGIVGHFSGGISNYTLISFKSNEPNVYSTSLGSYNSGMLFRTGATDRMYITSGGNVGIGTTSPTTYSGYTNLSIGGSSRGLVSIKNNANNDTGFLYNSGGNTLNLESILDNLILTSASGKDLIFNTNGSSERMRITSGGNVGIGTTAPQSKLHVVSSDFVSRFEDFSGNSNATFVEFFAQGIPAGSVIGSITRVGTTSAVAYNVTSDYRLKEDLKEINGLDKISKIKVYDFKWRNHTDRMDGVLAHELQEVVPYAVTGEKDAKEMQSVDYSKLVPILVKAIQELKQEIEILKNK